MAALVSVLQSLASALFGTNGIVVTFFGWLTSAAVLPYFGIGIAVSLLLLAVRVVKSAIWGD